jgi:hypothetical protein
MSTTLRPRHLTNLLNTQGHRIDPPLRHTASDIRHVRSQRLCFHDHLLGRCPWRTSNRNSSNRRGCQMKHGITLTEGQERALAVLARRTPCENGLGAGMRTASGDIAM